jgi:23S rRNA (guanosine2251-2'-O)-methyltransferase
MNDRHNKKDRNKKDRPHKSLGRDNKHTDLEASIRLYDENDFEKLLGEDPQPLVLILDCVQDPHNLGACLRTADAAGCSLVVMTRDKTAPLNETVRRIACGGAENLHIARVTNLARAMDKLKDLGVRIIGTADGAQKSIYQQDLSGPIGMVLGSEGEGMRRLTGDKCDDIARIPLSGTVPCLNLSVATGVCLFEAVRQRQ